MSNERIKIKINGQSFVCEETPYVVIDGPLQSKNEATELMVRVSDEVKKYSCMNYTASIDTMKLILENRTLRSSSLTYAKLNDKMEKQRTGISQFAGSRYITCFSHNEHESIPFWAYYGGNIKEEKIQMRFKNFADNLQNCINLDYAFLENRSKKIFFYSDEYKKTINANGILPQKLGSQPINEEFDIRNCIRRIEVFDVNYVSTDAESLSQDYSGMTTLSTNSDENNAGIQVPVYRPDILGREKTNPWDYEYETRIMCVLDQPELSFWDYIDLRLKDEFFRGLTVIMNPWADDDLEQRIKNIINDSSLPQDIKDSMSIIHSVVDGTVEL